MASAIEGDDTQRHEVDIFGFPSIPFNPEETMSHEEVSDERNEQTASAQSFSREIFGRYSLFSSPSNYSNERDFLTGQPATPEKQEKSEGDSLDLTNCDQLSSDLSVKIGQQCFFSPDRADTYSDDAMALADDEDLNMVSFQATSPVTGELQQEQAFEQQREMSSVENDILGRLEEMVINTEDDCEEYAIASPTNSYLFL